MNCRSARAYLMAYLDSELDASTTIEVNRHLDSCANCTERFASEQRLEAAVASRLRQAEPDEQSVFERTLAAVTGGGGQRGRWLGGGLAAAALVSALVFLLPGRLPDLVSSAALDHEKYRAGLTQPELVTSVADEVRSYLEPRLGISLGELPDSDGWQIVGPRMCRFRDVSVGLVMLKREGLPVSLFVLSQSDAESLGDGEISTGPSSFPVNPGYAVLALDNGTVRCAVGDIPLIELTQLVALPRK